MLPYVLTIWATMFVALVDTSVVRIAEMVKGGTHGLAE
jgi:hypothetical protein